MSVIRKLAKQLQNELWKAKDLKTPFVLYLNEENKPEIGRFSKENIPSKAIFVLENPAEWINEWREIRRKGLETDEWEIELLKKQIEEQFEKRLKEGVLEIIVREFAERDKTKEYLLEEVRKLKDEPLLLLEIVYRIFDADGTIRVEDLENAIKIVNKMLDILYP
jgi:hypothetical protein